MDSQAIAYGYAIGYNDGLGQGGGGGSDYEKWQRPSDWPQLGEPDANESILLIRNFSGTAISYQMYVTPELTDGANYSSGDKLLITWNGITAEITTNSAPIECNIGGIEYCIISVKCITEGYLVLDSGTGDSYYDVIDAHIGANVKLNYKTFLKAKLHHVKFFGWQLQEGLTYNYSAFFGERKVLRQVETTIPWTSIPPSMFYYQSLLESFDFSAVKNIGTYSFFGCNMLQDVHAPNLLTISEQAFNNCNFLKELYAPNLITIGNYAFNFCYLLKKITISALSAAADYSFASCYSLNEIIAPNLSSVGYQSFMNCRSLKNIEMQSLTTIGAYGFYGCIHLEKFNAPLLASIADYGFSGCYSLENINYASGCVISDTAFEGCIWL